jgi:hypothetical protein
MPFKCFIHFSSCKYLFFLPGLHFPFHSQENPKLGVPLLLRFKERGEAYENRLLFMTYNGWIMLAVGVGAFVGYLVFGNSTVTKSAACH